MLASDPCAVLLFTDRIRDASRGRVAPNAALARREELVGKHPRPVAAHGQLVRGEALDGAIVPGGGAVPGESRDVLTPHERLRGVRELCLAQAGIAAEEECPARAGARRPGDP